MSDFLFGHELPQFPLTNSTIAVAGSGTNMFTTTIESSPPDHLFVPSDEDPKEDEQAPVEIGDGSIFIYTTHNRESFLPYLPKGTPADEAYHREENVMKISNKLKEYLQGYGIEATVDQTDYWAYICSKRRCPLRSIV